ncbi:hypothetical protein K1T71_000262 [Dendrolimus kikuchii]|uniref:Uncharacterized protein n=1 Tax=Dendrolimus kikuchii TaxID=765133 RepID=A0ACC1DIP2_9NEOP|nr:hypothetical protein K1T71_000262 [Dendrolimus kikuchii]
MTLGFPTILIPAVEHPKEDEILRLQKSEISWISSINLIVVPLGCSLSGIVSSPLGRRKAMQLVNIPFFLAWLTFHFSTSIGHLYGALFLTGFAGGLLEAPVLTYVAEITQPHLRGALTATSSMCIILGVFTQFLFGLFMYWRTVAVVNIIFTISAVIALFFIPESPHWLASRKRYAEAKKSLQWLRGWTTADAVEQELKDIRALYNKEKDTEDVEESLKEKINHYFKRSFLVPYFIISLAFFVGHFSGMTTLQTYAVSIFQLLEAPLDKYYATLVLGIIQIIGSGMCVLLVHYSGKRPLALISTAGASICCLLVACYDLYLQTKISPNAIKKPTLNTSNTNLTDIGSIDQQAYSWIPTTLLFLLAFVTHFGIRLLPWILVGEIFNAKTRSGGAGLSGAIGYIFGFLTNKMYISMVDTLSIWGTYGFYSLVCFIGSIIFYFILPETEGKKLNEIEDHFAGIRKMSNEVYRSKKKPKVDASILKDLKGTTNPTFEDDSVK